MLVSIGTKIDQSSTGVIARNQQRNSTSNSTRKVTKTSVALWTIQGLLAALFAFAGASKLVMSAEAMSDLDFGLPLWFLRFIGVAEVLGAVGLILPCALRIREGLTPLAAAGLVCIMVGATTLVAASGDVAGASFPLLVGAFSAVIAYRRSQPIVHTEVAVGPTVKQAA